MADWIWQERSNRLKALLSKGDPALVFWVSIPWPPIMEIAGACGIDAALIDLEHTTTSLESVQNLIVAAQLAKITPLVRPPSHERSTISRILDAGAEGIVFARIEDG